MLDHPELVEKFGGAGRSRVEERFDLLKQVRKLESKYKELIG
jgi:glycosyltransferase involved in cell wall biosynthesis